MNDDRTLLEQRRESRNAFQKGVREGWDQAVWLVVGVAVVIAAVTW